MSLCAKPLIENEFDLHENELVVEKHFQMSDFVRRRSLKKRQEAIRNLCKFLLQLTFIFVLLQRGSQDVQSFLYSFHFTLDVVFYFTIYLQ